MRKDALDGLVRYTLDRMCPPGGRRGFAVFRECSGSTLRIECGEVPSGHVVMLTRGDRTRFQFIRRSQFESLMSRLRQISLDHSHPATPSEVLGGEVYFLRILHESGEVRSVYMHPRDDSELVSVADGLDKVIDAVAQLFPPEGWLPRILSALRNLFRRRNTPPEAAARY